MRFTFSKLLNSISLFSLLLIYNQSVVVAQSIVSVDQVISETVANNPQIKVSFQSLEYSRGSFRVARSKFNTEIRLNGDKSRDITPYSLSDASDNFVSKYWGLSLSASRKIPFGTVITPSVGVINTGRDILYQQLGRTPANQGSVFIDVQQPILRGFGTSYNTAELRIAELNINTEEHRYLFDASFLLLDAMSAYVEYIAAQLNLEIQVQTESSMAETVRQLRRLVELDAIPGSELVVSEANLANQKTNTALAENRLALSKNILATSMGISLEAVNEMGSAPTDFPFSITPIRIDAQYTNAWFDESLQRRHDYLATSNELDASLISLDFYKKGMLPRLNLALGAGYNGLYQADGFGQYYKPLAYNIPGMNYRVGLTFDISPRYDFQKGQRKQALALNDAAKANIDYIQLQIKKEVQRDCDQLKFLLGAVESVNEAVSLSEKALQNEKKKLEMGLTTAFSVALMQNSYLNARERQNGLMAQLNQALLQFKHHTGTLLEATGNSAFTVNTNQLFLLPQAP